MQSMNNKFLMKQSKTIKMLIGLLTFLLVAYVLAVVISMLNKEEFVLTSLIFPLFFATILLVVLITFRKSNYAIVNDNLVVTVSIGKTTIPLDTITTIKYLKTTNELILCHFVNEDPRLNLVQIRDCDYDKFVKALRNANPKIIYQEILDDKL